MTVFLAEPLSGSKTVIGENPESTHPELEEENTLIEQVWQRSALLKTNRSLNTPAEYRIKLQGEHALETLLKRHNARICALVIEYQPKEGSADEDLKQEAIAAFIESIDSFDPQKGARLSTHAYWIIRAKLQTITSKENRNQIATAKALFEPEDCETLEPIDSYELGQLQEAIGQLSQKEQQIIQLRNQDIPFAEIAQIFERSIKRIQNLYYEARRRLKSLLGILIDPVAEKPETVEQIAVEADIQKDFEQKRVVFGTEPITNQKQGVDPDPHPSCLHRLIKTIPICDLLQRGQNMASLHQSKFSSWFSAQRLPIWAAYALGGVTVAFHSILSPELLIILLCSLAIAGLLAIDKHKKNMPKPIRQIASVAILTAFSWCSIVLSYPAHALVFSRISAGLSHAISGEGTSASDITAWVAKFLSILVFVAICGLIVGWFRRGRENEEESKRAS